MLKKTFVSSGLNKKLPSSSYLPQTSYPRLSFSVSFIYFRCIKKIQINGT
jgi:hypothetical protein